MEEGTVYPDYRIHDFIEKDVVHSNTEINLNEKGGQIQPASLDLRCGFGKRVWHIPYSSNPSGKNLLDLLESKSTHSFLLDEKRFMHKQNVYIIELEEELNLPSGIFARSNPKSTTGRCDIHVRLLTENGQSFDQVKEGYKGRLFLELVSNSFDLEMSPGFSLNQIRFYRENDVLDQKSLRHLARGTPLLFDNNEDPLPRESYVMDGATSLTLDLEPNDLGYKSREDAPKLDLSSEINSLPLSEYFESINLCEGGIVIIPDSFYLLKSRERSKIPEFYCAEMVDISTDIGEFRAHYAGYFDSGFDSISVLEVRNMSKTSILLNKGQMISSLKFYEMVDKPKTLYGECKNSNYQGQSQVRPAKFFHNDLKKEG